MKLLGNLLDVYNMGEYEYLPYFSDMVLYAGDLMTFDKQGIKKHYFVEGERFLTNCGSEGHPAVDPLGSIKGIEPKDLIDMSKNFENNIISYFTAHKYSDCRDTNIREAKIDELLMYRYKEFADILRDNQKPEFYYLHTDRLGSGSAVTDGRGEAVHVLGYMPYGETLLDLSHTHYETPYQFTGYEKDQETGLHYAEARYYDSRLSIFNSTDPMWYKYPHQSPYTYCSNNPIMRIDPDGRADDEWDINRRGEIVNHIKTDKHDAFYMVDDNGERIEGKSVRFEYGTVEKFKSQYSDNAKTTFDWYNIRGDNNGKHLFEFFANNTEVEWSQFKTGNSGEKGLNFITTSHSEYMESAGIFLYNNLLRHKYFIREHIHNHPKGLPVPSGMPGTTQEGSGDISFVSVLNKNNKIHKYSGTIFKIYSKGFGYNSYNESSRVGDFEHIYNKIGLKPLRN